MGASLEPLKGDERRYLQTFDDDRSDGLSGFSIRRRPSPGREHALVERSGTRHLHQASKRDPLIVRDEHFQFGPACDPFLCPAGAP
jgi:hypothetical protein